MATSRKPERAVAKPDEGPELFEGDTPNGAITNAYSGVDLTPQFAAIFEGDIKEVPSIAMPETESVGGEAEWRPGVGRLIDVSDGGPKPRLYLKARDRLLWMRQEQRPHPDWGIETEVTHFVPGERNGHRIVGGYAVVHATVRDERGRIIAQGTKSERTEDFKDALEKAETGAIGRALAVAGYATESAIEFDEGVSESTGELRIADAPADSGPINITPSAVPGIRQGGRSTKVTSVQLEEIKKRLNLMAFDPLAVAVMIKNATGSPVEVDPSASPREQSASVWKAMQQLSFEEGGKVLASLSEEAA